MLLTCPECAMRYIVSAAAVGPEGRKVRCANCAHEWFQAPEGPAPDTSFQQILEEEMDVAPVPEPDEPPPPIPEGSSVPAMPDEEARVEYTAEQIRGRWIGMATATGIILLIVGMLFALKGPVTRAMPGTILLYNLAGAKVDLPGEDLIIDSLLAYTEKDKDGVEALKLEGSILNLKEGTKIPKLVASLRTADGQTKETWIIDPPKDYLGQGESFDFTGEYPALADDIKEVNLTFAAFMKDTPATVEEPEDEHAADASGENHAEEPVMEEHPAADAHEEKAPEEKADEGHAAPAHH